MQHWPRELPVRQTQALPYCPRQKSLAMNLILFHCHEFNSPTWPVWGLVKGSSWTAWALASHGLGLQALSLLLQLGNRGPGKQTA